MTAMIKPSIDERKVSYIVEAYSKATSENFQNNKHTTKKITSFGNSMADLIEIRGHFSKMTADKAISTLRKQGQICPETIIKYYMDKRSKRTICAIIFIDIKMHIPK